MKNFKTSELLILAITVVLIFVSEYYYIFENNADKAIFIGLWPPTILCLLIYINSKNKKQKISRSKPTRGTIADMDDGGVRFPEREVDVDEDMPGEWVKYIEKRVRDTNTNT